MSATIIVAHIFKKIPEAPGVAVVNACNNKAGGEWAGINPFLNGPCDLYDGHTALVMENAWQFSKVYQEHADDDGNPTQEYWDWAKAGWANPKAVRFPMGKGRAPLYCLWKGERLGYVESRKKIYGPLFKAAAEQTGAYRKLQELHQTATTLYIRDWDGWCMKRHKMANLDEVLHNPKRKMGHGFFLKAMLDQDPILDLLG